MKIRTLLLVIAIFFSSNIVYAKDKIIFDCSWDNNKPIQITVDPSLGIATRNDGGKNYKIIKISKYAVWLEVVEPNNYVNLKVQMLERSAASNKKVGRWVDTIHYLNGTTSSISGGVCWER